MKNRLCPIRYTDKFASFDLSRQLKHLIYNVDKDFNKLCFICIGTDRSTGDSYGPLVGHMLSKIKLYKYEVYGTLENPVHAKNLDYVLNSIENKSTLIIAIDSCLGNLDNIGNISVRYGGIKPGSGVGKDLPEVGDLSISGIVNVGGFASHLVLQCTRLNTVLKMAEITSASIRLALHEKYKLKKFDKAHII